MGTNFAPEETKPVSRFYDFSNNGIDWVTTQVNSREPLTMEYRKELCADLPYYCVERMEYYRYCCGHVEEPKNGEERVFTKEEIAEVVREFQVLARSEKRVMVWDAMAEEILRLRLDRDEWKAVALVD